ncbi:MAG: LptA/OstA family protein [Steroidobacteraceae bacterium]
MAVSLPDLRALLLALPLIAAPLALDAASPRSQRTTTGDRALTIDANSWQVDYNSHHLIMKDVTITQGDVSIRAQEAEANSQEMSFDGSRWEFRGDVRIRFEDGNLSAQHATVNFTGNRIALANASGSPAEFEQRIEKLPNPAKGRAGNIAYDVNAGRLTLSQGTWLSDGRGEYRSDDLALVYNLRERRLQSGGEAIVAPEPSPGGGKDSGGRIHITIQPKDEAAETPPQ